MRIPLRATPQTDEPIDTFLERISWHTTVSLGYLYKQLNLSRSERSFSPALMLPRSAEDALVAWTGLAPSQIRTHTITGVVPTLGKQTPSPNVADIIERAHRRWLFVAHSRFCTQCSAEEQPWKIQWRLPWSVACERHAIILSDQCPRCHHNPRERIRGASTTREPETPVNPNVCQRPAEPHTPGRLTPRCNTPLHVDSHNRFAGDLIRSQESVMTAIAKGVTLHGKQLTADQALTLAIDVARLTLRRTRNDPRLAPLRDLEDSCRVVACVSAVLASPDSEEAARIITQHSSTTDDFTHNEVLKLVSRRTGPISPIADHLLAPAGRVSTQLRRRQLYFTVTDATCNQVPLLFWRCALPQNLAASGADVKMRFLVSLSMAKMITGTWEDAAEGLGFPRHRGRAWSKHLINSVSRDLRPLLGKTCQDALQSLSNAPIQPRASLPTLRQLTTLPETTCHYDDEAAWCPCIARHARRASSDFSRERIDFGDT